MWSLFIFSIIILITLSYSIIYKSENIILSVAVIKFLSIYVLINIYIYWLLGFSR